MKRLFWLAVGAGVGVLVVRKLSEKADQLTPGGLAEQLGEQVNQLSVAVRSFGEEIRAGMQAREDELRSSLNIQAEEQVNGFRGLDAEATARLADERHGHWRDQP